MATSKEVRAMVAKVKTIFRKHGYKVDAILNSPYSNSVYFDYYSNSDRGEVRVSDHDYPNHNHNFRGYDFNLNLGAEAIEEMIEELEWEISE